MPLQDILPRLTSKQTAQVQDYFDTAVKAMEWAEAELATIRDPIPSAVSDARNLAAVELYRASTTNVIQTALGQQAASERWPQIFLNTTPFTDAEAPVSQWPNYDQKDAAFVYAQLDESLVNRTIQSNARAALIQEADQQLIDQQRTGFKWLKNPSAPLAWGDSLGSPKADTLVRAHVLTGKTKYHRGTVLATQYAAGANPDNMSYTTGLGYRQADDPVLSDPLSIGVEPPPGITLYGPFDTDQDPDYFAFNLWEDVTTPSTLDWPVTEGFFDSSFYIPVAEFTVDATMAPTTYAWGYLASLAANSTSSRNVQNRDRPSSPNPLPIHSRMRRNVKNSSDHPNIWIGDENNNRLHSHEGNDVMWGQGGRDRLRGGKGQDVLYGGSDSDILTGGAGRDVLIGSMGQTNMPEVDHLTGSGGRDRFILGVPTASSEQPIQPLQSFAKSNVQLTNAYHRWGNDDYAVIHDFEPGLDQIQLPGRVSNYRIGTASVTETIHPTSAALFDISTGQRELVAVFNHVSPKDLRSHWKTFEFA